VFLFDVATRRWSPDPAYSHLLDDGWNLQEVGCLQQLLVVWECEQLNPCVYRLMLGQ
jgi:hypothetical protein